MIQVNEKICQRWKDSREDTSTRCEPTWRTLLIIFGNGIDYVDGTWLTMEGVN